MRNATKGVPSRSRWRELSTGITAKINATLDKETEKHKQSIIECREWKNHLEWAERAFNACDSKDLTYDSRARMFAVADARYQHWVDTERELNKSIQKLNEILEQALESKRNLELSEKSQTLIENLDKPHTLRLAPVSDNEITLLRQMAFFLDGYEEIRRSMAAPIKRIEHKD